MRWLHGKNRKQNNNIAFLISILLIYILTIFTHTVFTQELADANLNELEVPGEEEDDSTDPNLNAWCFRFTWLGPKYDRNYKTFLNQSCKDIIKLSKGVPCVTPLVVTNNSGLPDTDWIWDQHKSKPEDIACKAAGGDICAKYTFMFDGRIENITYMCTKVNIENGTSPKSGCFKEVRNNRITEVCVCEPQVGRMPCNSGISHKIMHNLIVFTFVLIISYGLFKSSLI